MAVSLSFVDLVCVARPLCLRTFEAQAYLRRRYGFASAKQHACALHGYDLRRKARASQGYKAKTSPLALAERSGLRRKSLRHKSQAVRITSVRKRYEHDGQV